MRRHLLLWLGLSMAVARVADAGGRDVVLVRKECPPDSSCVDPTKPCCFETLWKAEAYVGWRTAADPALIDIGPGDFAQEYSQGPSDNPLCVGSFPGDSTACAAFRCGTGHVTLRGAGRGRTRIINTRNSAYEDGAAIFADHRCEDLVIQDLTIAAKSSGVWWSNGGGSSTWIDVDVLGGVFGWYEVGVGDRPQGVHYWYGSKVGTITPQNTRPYVDPKAGEVALDNRSFKFYVAFASSSSQTWFYGGEIFASGLQVPTGGGARDIGLTGVMLSNGQNFTQKVGGDLRVFGSAIRVTGAAANESGTLDNYNVFGTNDALKRGGMTGVFVSDHSTFHAHGANVNVSASTTAHDHATGNDVYVPLSQDGTNVHGLEVLEHGHAHAPATSFVLNGTPTGRTRRIVDAGTSVTRIQAPTQWPAGVAPPTSPAGSGQLVESTHGQDTYVEIDCECTGDCDGTGNEPHLMVFSVACPGQWFDMVTGRCRGDLRPCA